MAVEIALIANAVWLSLFAIGHIARAPWLIHRDSDIASAADNRHWGWGVFGISVLVAMLLGAVAGGIALYASRQPGSLSVKFPPPTSPTINITKISPPAKEQCWVKNYAAPALPSPPSWGITTIVCNTTIKPPYSVELNYDQTVTVGPFTFPVGSEFQKCELSVKGAKVVAIYELHTIIPNEPLSIMAQGPTDKFPLVKTAVIRAKGLVLEFHP